MANRRAAICRSRKARAPSILHAIFQSENAIGSPCGKQAWRQRIWDILFQSIAISHQGATLPQQPIRRGPADAHRDAVAIELDFPVLTGIALLIEVTQQRPTDALLSIAWNGFVDSSTLVN